MDGLRAVAEATMPSVLRLVRGALGIQDALFVTRVHWRSERTFSFEPG